MAIWNKGQDGPVTEEKVLDVLKRVQDPDLHKDIVSLGFIRNLKIDGGNVAFDHEPHDARVSREGSNARRSGRVW